ncbi:MAG: polysaccharide deacetylase family protein [Bacteroidetes bacterium]|nr:polysaccharide deacetylase family protein [Bacteroidota bacterium]
MSSISGIIPVEILKQITRQKTIFPFYHLISDEEVPHVKFLYRIRNTKEFIADLDLFLKHYKPIGVAEVLDSYKADRPLPENSFLLSFDDGLREFNDVVAPILLQKGIPATCFLNSGFVDNRDLFYRYKASLLIGRLKETGIQTEPVRTWFRDHHLSENTHDYGLLTISYSNRYLLDELAVLLDYDFGEYLRKNHPYLDFAQIQTLIRQGFTFGAHSIDHPEFRFLPENEQIRQTSQSILDIKEKFGLYYKLFSFPFTDFGIQTSFFDRIFDPAEPFADLTFGGAGLKRDSVRKNIQRIPFEEGSLNAKQILATEYAYYMIKSIFGKNLIRR